MIAERGRGKKQPSALVKQAVPVNNGGIFDSSDGPNGGDGMHTELQKWSKKNLCLPPSVDLAAFHQNDL